jgi:hypothetical protein
MIPPKREGPYQVVKCHEKGAYHLISTEGKRLLRAWNAEHLKKNTICDIHVISLLTGMSESNMQPSEWIARNALSHLEYRS